jgi:DNA-binding Xre family transcriptional regulator
MIDENSGVDKFKIQPTGANRPRKNKIGGGKRRSMTRTSISKLLIEKGMTNTDLYYEIKRLFPLGEVSHATLSKIIKGDAKSYNTNTLLKISAALDTTPNDIIDVDWEALNS